MPSLKDVEGEVWTEEELSEMSSGTEFSVCDVKVVELESVLASIGFGAGSEGGGALSLAGIACDGVAS